MTEFGQYLPFPPSDLHSTSGQKRPLAMNKNGPEGTVLVTTVSVIQSLSGGPISGVLTGAASPMNTASSWPPGLV